MVERPAHAVTEPGNARVARYREIRFVTLAGSVIDLLLGVVKVLVGTLAHSAALLADGLHSFSDLATDVLLLWAARHAHREADEDHAYGHARIETATTVALGAVMVAVALGIVWEAAQRLLRPELVQRPDVAALWVAVASVLLKEATYQYTIRAARRLDSRLLRANAWHSRSDSISSLVVIVGVGGAMLGVPYVDAVAAVVVAWMIARIGWDLADESVRELVDTAVAPEQLEDIRRLILSVDGVRALHLLRTRRMAGKALVEVHILLADPRISVSEGHQIGERVRARLRRRLEAVEDVTVHVDHEYDEPISPSRELPPRAELLDALRDRWAAIGAASSVREVRLHYIGGRVEVEVELPVECAHGRGGAERLTELFRDAAADLTDVAVVRLLFS